MLTRIKVTIEFEYDVNLIPEKAIIDAEKTKWLWEASLIDAAPYLENFKIDFQDIAGYNNDT